MIPLILAPGIMLLVICYLIFLPHFDLRLIQLQEIRLEEVKLPPEDQHSLDLQRTSDNYCSSAGLRIANLKPESEITPHRESEITPHRDSVVSQHDDSEITPHHDSEVTYRDSEGSPHHDSEITPHRDLGVSPHHDSEITPHHDSEVTHRDSEDSPHHDSEITPHRDSEVSPHHESEITHRDLKGSPHHDSENTPRHDSEVTHRDSEDSPHHDSEITPHRDSEVSPHHDSEITPHHDSEVTHRDLKGSPHHDSEITPHRHSEIIQHRDSDITPHHGSEITSHRDSEDSQVLQHDVEQLELPPLLHHHLFTLDGDVPSFFKIEHAALMELINMSDDPHDHDREQQLSNLERIVNYLHQTNAYLEAAEMGDVNRLQSILEEGSVDRHQLDFQGRNAVHLAIMSDSSEAVELLLKAGVDPNVKDHLNMTPLSMCLTVNPSKRVAQLLFKYGAKILTSYSPSDSGLFLQYVIRCSPECTDEEVEILHLLVEKGAVINDPKAPGGRQALHLAAMSNNCRLIEVLVEMGADLTLVNHRGETPAETAMTFKCWDAFHFLEELELAMVADPGNTATNSNLPVADRPHVRKQVTLAVNKSSDSTVHP